MDLRFLKSPHRLFYIRMGLMKLRYPAEIYRIAHSDGFFTVSEERFIWERFHHYRNRKSNL